MKLTKKIEQFIKLESTSGLILLTSAIFALIWANVSPVTYSSFLQTTTSISLFNSSTLTLTTTELINDVLMALFFFVVGVELKVEIMEGSLSSVRKTMLPATMAMFGFILPAIIYSISIHFDQELIKGWAIPTATDIAFALGILSIFGERVPRNLKLLLLALAVIDDLFGIITIAIFYTSHIDYVYLGLFFSTILLCVVFNKYAGIRNIGIYFFMFALMWVFAHKSGIHSTIAGIALAFTMPFKGTPTSPTSPAKVTQKAILPYSSFVIIPLFTIANAGVYLLDATPSDLLNNVTIGLILGLVLGKMVGISLSAIICFKLKIFKIPKGVTNGMILSIAALGGIGFTVALFVGGLSGVTPIHYKLGIFIGTALSAVIGATLLHINLPRTK
ncbi:Na+/H+ antiporter NhaA [Photobacterium damselae]|uniref:Na+/H+ antiporter NhaA n=1 Tax=Photobacterium damselae TaxID=38293 RepID=UPI001EEDA9F3|nr:Na+/H+ antiporter NhaA [Photobacterium damselae]UKA04475.1 Na+/H+ antiporter NhaA [Photobacterium damselae subsp. damselae]